MKNYIKSKNENKFYIEKVIVSIKDKLEHIPLSDVKVAISKSLSKIPSHLLTNIKNIYVGDFQQLKNRDLEAMYKNSTIYVNNEYKRAEQMIDDIVHEVAHSVEEVYDNLIYSDKELEKEFLQKRKTMWHLMKSKGYELELEQFLNTDYDLQFDKMLYKNVGYPILSALTSEIFYSPYAATSLREYFASGFEAFFMKEKIKMLKSISPVLYKKMIILLDIKGEKQ